jgi:acetylornithine/N-succinyldiaminopimelate aminotransferase
MARRYHWANGNPERNRIITFEGSFHGRTMATISAAGGSRLTEGFAPLLDGFDHLPFGDHEALRAAVNETTAAIMIEPVQGEGGIRPIPRQCFEGLRELCDEHGILLIFDEVQCGMGRTGHLFAHESFSVAPDIMSSAKGLGGGFPIGACLATARAASGMTTSSHGSTFGGNPLACAVANAVLDVMLADGFLDEVAERGRQLNDRLADSIAKYESVMQLVRGQGLMLGIKTNVPNTEFAKVLREQGLLTVPAADNIVRLLPPLTVSEEEIGVAIEKIETAAEVFAKGEVA